MNLNEMLLYENLLLKMLLIVSQKSGFSLYRCYLEFFFDGFYYVKGTVGVISIESTCKAMPDSRRYSLKLCQINVYNFERRFFKIMFFCKSNFQLKYQN